MVYISHLDLMTLFRRAIRRSGIPFLLTGGFTPRVKISMPNALKLGVESKDESMQFWMMEKMEEGLIMDKINAQLPEGIKIFKIKPESE